MTKLGTKEFKIPFFDLFKHMQKYVYIAHIAHYIICAIYCIYMQKCVFNMCIYLSYIHVCIYISHMYAKILRDIDMLQGLFLEGETLSKFFKIPFRLWSYFSTVSMSGFCSFFKRGKGSITYPARQALASSQMPVCTSREFLREWKGGGFGASPIGAGMLATNHAGHRD